MAVDAEEIVEVEYFETSHTVVAAYLTYMGHELAGTVWENRQCVFQFAECEQLTKDMALFNSNKALVEPSAYSNTYGQMRKVMFGVRDQNQRRAS
jgi:hypothetical protein